ncbi:MAG: hypothetical protein IPH68_07290 [Chitinophagaceae bacterium]|nr:hypothetical protein [Chitinophagaceae bacterium]
MKRIVMISAALFFLAACNNADDKSAEKKVKYSDLANDNLKGAIEGIEDTPYQADSTGKAGAMDSCCIEITQFDENGNAVKVTTKDSKGTVTKESVFTRHENGLWTGASDTKDGKPAGGMKVTVDDKGMYTLAQTTDSAGKPDMYYTNITQNDFGQVTGWKQYDKDSVFRGEGASTFDKSLFTGFTSKDSVGKVTSTTAVKYNDKGEQVENTNTNITKDSTTTKGYQIYLRIT